MATATATATATEESDAVCTKEDQTDKIIRRNMMYAMGAGIVPIPMFDLAVISGLQMKMLYEFSGVYDVSFPRGLVKSILASLIGGLGVFPIAAVLAGSVSKFIPGIGNIISVISLPLTAGAVTYAIGKVFVMHFESGGTFLNFNAKKMQAYFAEMYKEGKDAASNAKEEGKSK